MRQEIRFCAAPDDVRLAWAKHGSGPPIVKTGTWLTHLEFDWESPVWRHWLEWLGEAHVRRWRQPHHEEVRGVE